MSEFNYVKNLVGDITKENLKYVEYYVSKNFGIFIPIVGFCEYAIKENHTHPGYSFIIYFNTKEILYPCNIAPGESEYLVQAVSPTFPHNEDGSNEFTRYIAVFISKEFFENEYKKYKVEFKEYRFDNFTINKNIITYIEKFIGECEEDTLGREEILNSTSTIITHELIRGLIGISSCEKTKSIKGEIENAVNYMHQHFSEKITISSLSSMCNMSESGFNKMFRDELLTSPMDYLIKIRIDKAKKLLRSNSKSITQISLECGFSSLSHFSSCFTKHMNMTPREYEALYK